MNIFLCGLPTVGKTRFGQVLAQYLSFPFFDTDDLILHSYGENQYPSIKKIFQAVGEKTFSSWEIAILRSLSMDKSVVSLGGGTLLHQEAVSLIKNKGTLVLLSLPLPRICERLKHRGVPERLKSSQDLMHTLQERIDFMHRVVDYQFPMAEVDLSKETSLFSACKSFLKLLNL
ncbi:shikimate kinase [Chlamydia gallinacea]|uniref:Shikimate kinase n=2 Tax=Chlamydia gallinacea TaxID=1457153 RepID=A0A173DY09_9CHLA|nr:shikimate kinase [Chlamydia gallinacea]EYE60879.1 shikimate kinase family protein [Bacteroides fragilis str. S6L5]ANG65803.1 shikimate kinase [Chlamydia gallinacea 08-1274/3]AQT77139.1 shikimate kinase [Chlamydia gallinacea]MBX6680359.1 shikimate kinase [Chlamydia gallinacea]MBX6687519.1 shikimate kinase [Chlamydia gallinacea]